MGSAPGATSYTEQQDRPGDGISPRRRMARRFLAELRKDNLGDWAAALTYYAVLSSLPALLVLTSLLGAIGPSLTEPLLREVSDLAPGPAHAWITRVLTAVERRHTAAGIVGTLTLIWAASRYAAAFIRAMNAVYDVPEGRPTRLLLPLRIGLTVLTLLMVTTAAAVVVLSGRLADRVGVALGAGHSAVTAWQWGKWPLLLLLAGLLIALLYWAAPNARQPFRWGTPGGLVAVAVWGAASTAFAYYAAHFGSYDRVYGSLAAAITFLIWVWLANLALLLGAELNAEWERERAIAQGHPADQEPYMPLRSAVRIHDDAL
ncbi:YihY/virulence factor BrkB family protein [Streptomyces aquilus]|uniref:YihY/virulence factor BrkB family protein n=1 Tax=Streptomyces aquilus TaxID=2548456 RepID=UPI0037D09BC8